MEQLNRIELIGIVGSVYVKDFGNTKCANFSVATNYCFKDREGCPVIETTWHRVIAWEGGPIRNLERLQKGSHVHVIGRLRMQRYMCSNGTERTRYEVMPGKVEVITD